MDKAYSGNKPLSASNFARLSDEERAFYRGKLECEGCGAEAHFRKKSTNGRQKAHFAAHHHEHCTLIAAGTSSAESENSSGTSTGKKSSARIIIRPNVERTQNRTELSESSGQPEVRYASSSGGQGKGSGAPSWLGLHSTLTKLLHDPDFSKSNRIVQVENFPELPASEFFVSLTSGELDQMYGERRGFWGKIVSIGSSASGLWLNNGGDDGPNVWIPTELVSEAKRRFGFDNVSAQQVTMVLALGQLDRSPITKYIKIHDLSFLAVAKV